MAKDNINTEMLNVLNENIKYPFITVAVEGNMLSFNKPASSLFGIKENGGNIFDYFDEETSYQLSRLIEDVLSGKKTVTKNVVLILSNGTNIKVQATLTEYDQSYIFCTFKPEEHNLKISEITKLKIKQDELSNIFKNKDLKRIIESIKDSYPFTVLGKEKIRKEINALQEFFWLKNNEGMFILVNDALASNLGINSQQLEGRNQSELLPVYLQEVYNSLENYVQDSHNVIVLEGIPIQGLSALSEFQTVEIPLTNTEGKLAAIIGISQKIDKNDTLTQPAEKNNLLEDIPVKLAELDEEGIFKHSSKEFSKLFSDEFTDLRNLSYTKVFPLEISDRIKKILDSDAEVDDFRVKISVKSEQRFSEFKVLLKRNYGESNKPGGLSVLLEEISPEVDLEKIIKSRGKMFEILIQNNPEPIFIYDKENLRFIEVNLAALNLYGYRRDEFLQMDLTDLYTPEDIQTLLDSTTGNIKEGVFTGPYRHKRKDGNSVFVEISKISFNFNNKDAHFNVIRDVTQKLEIEKQNQIFKAAFESAVNLIIVTDSSGFIKSANKVALNFIGVSEGDLNGSTFVSLVVDDDRAQVNNSIFQLRKKETVNLKVSLKKSNGEISAVELFASPVLDYKNEIESFIIVLRNEPVAAERQIKEIIVEKIIEKEPEQSERIDPAFLSGIFHEILTPINAMLGFVQELTDSADLNTPEQIEAKDIIDQNRRRLLSTMNSVVEYSRMEQEPARVEIKDVSITEIVDLTQEEISDILKNKGIDFAYGKISSSLNFKTDSQKFISLITLLFKIASQFTNTKKIYFSAYQIDDQNFLISIQDNYSSMSQSFSENFYNIFNKGIVNKDYGFSKLSVKLARNLIKLLQGKFVEKSQKTSGFIFPIELKPQEVKQEKESSKSPQSEETEETIKPVKEIRKTTKAQIVEKVIEPEPEEEESFSDSAYDDEESEIKFMRHSSKHKKTAEQYMREDESYNKSRIDLSQLSCLYIEDQVDSQILFKVQLKELKQIKFAVSFEEALPLLDSHHFDFIVLDINLQGEYNGLDALKIIHRMPGYETIPILAVTAYVLPGDREKFIAAGFNDFISKPIFREKMVDSLEKIFYTYHS